MDLRSRLKLEEGWSTFFLLWMMLLVASSAIVQTNLIDGLQVVSVAVTGGLFAGLALAKSEFKDRTAFLYAFVFGLFAVFYLVGYIMPGEEMWRERVLEIVSRQGAWLQKAVSGGTSRDGLIFVIQTTAVYWVLGFTGAWYTFRKPRLWRVVLPTGLVLLSVVYYYNGPRPLLLYLAAYAILALLYAVRTNVNEQEHQWRQAAVRYDKGIWFSFLRAGLVASIILLLFSWSLPTLSANTTVNDALSSTQGPWREFQDNWTRLFSSLRTYGAGTADPYQESLVLGGPRSVGNTLIMDVSVPRELRSVYWQAIAYDTYVGNGWRVGDDLDNRLHFPEDGPLPVPTTLGREAVTYTVYNYVPNTGFIYAAPEIISSDKQMFVEGRLDEQDLELVTAARSRYILRQGDTYEVTSRISTADAESLRNAGVNYPAWVTENYVQLPDVITPETKQLAVELTTPFDNAFDKTIAVRDYLRNTITYNDQIDAPPDGVEPVHYILFESQEGYCNYYASAMAVMLRSQGIPSRVVSGYAQGDYDEESSSYRVRANNAHTWVEVYFPQYGWIQFEPTVSIPTVDRPETSGGGDAFASSVFDGPPDPLEEETNPRLLDDPGIALEGLPEQTNSGWTAFDFPVWQAVLAVVVLLIAGLVVFVAYESNRRAEGDIDRSYGRLGFWAGLLGILYGPADTPYERAERMTAAVPQGQAPIRKLTHEYVRKLFSNAYQSDEGFDPREQWSELRPILIKESFALRYRRWRARRDQQS